MGLAASQARFCSLTARKHNISRQLQHLSLEKMALTRDMRNVTQNYQKALSTKTMKWSNNSGVSYTDISYSTLMRPNSYNSTSPVLITNSAGKVVVDDKYKKYAEIISKDGSSGGDYASHRTEILCALIGITPEQLKADADTAADVNAKYQALVDADEAKSGYGQNYDAAKFIKDFMSPSKLGLSGTTVTPDNVDSVVSTVKNSIAGKNYFSSDIYEKFNKTCDDIAEQVKSPNSIYKEKDADSVKISIDDFLSSIVSGALGSTFTVMVDKKGNGTQSEYEAALKAYDDAYASYKSSASAHEEVFTASEESQIRYYDQLFQAIVDNGWSYDGAVADSEYLNQKFQNNDYYITTIVDNSEYNPDGTLSGDYDYDTSAATSFDNIFMVNDSDAANEALVDYEYQKSIISEKESRIDTRMKNLETEQSAISKMLESIDQVKNDNIERTFGIWG